MSQGHPEAGMKISRVHPGEWLAGLAGIALLAGLMLPWDGDTTALSSPGFLDVVLTALALAGILLPVIVAGSSRTNVPIVYETFLWTITLLFALVMIVKAFFPPEGGFGNGFWLALLATVVLSFTLWRSVDRER